MDTVAVERLPNSVFLRTSKPTYVDNFGLLPLLEKIAFRSNIILVGPKGIGKSLAVAHFAASHETHMVTFDCSSDVRRHHLIGTPTLRGDQSPFVLGPIPTVIEIANEVGACILNLEEISALSQEMQKILNPLTDFRRRVEVPEAKQVYELRAGARLWVVGTTNTSNYGGTHQINEDLKSRFDMPPLTYPEDESEVVASELSAASIKLDQSVITKALTMAKNSRQRATDYALSPRDVVRLLINISLVGVNKALWMTSGKFDELDRVWFEQEAFSTFGEVLPGAKPRTLPEKK